MRARVLLLLAVAGPPLLLAGLGLANPAHLTADSADAWKNLHLVLLPVFPLLARARSTRSGSSSPRAMTWPTSACGPTCS